MSMTGILGGKKPPPKTNVATLPNAGNVPAPAARPAPVEQAYAEEALRAAQRTFDMIREIERLNAALDDAERRAITAEAEVRRLEGREANLTHQLEHRTAMLMDERDRYRFRLHNLLAQFETAGAIILKCMDAAKNEAGSKTSGLNLEQLAREIEQGPTPPPPPLPPDDPVPQVVRRGPDEPAA